MVRFRRRSNNLVASNKRRSREPYRRLLLTVGFLVIFVVAAAMAYAWWAGQSSEEISTIDKTVQPVRRASGDVPPPAKNAPVGVAVQSFPDSVTRGGAASVQVRTRPSASCRMEISYEQGEYTDIDLVPAVANKYGVASWDWQITESLRRGTWPITVTCSYEEKSGVMVVELTID